MIKKQSIRALIKKQNRKAQQELFLGLLLLIANMATIVCVLSTINQGA